MHILRTGKTIHDLKFGEFHIDWIVVFAEKYLDFVLEDGWAPLDDQQDVTQSHILYLRTERKHGD